MPHTHTQVTHILHPPYFALDSVLAHSTAPNLFRVPTTLVVLQIAFPSLDRMAGQPFYAGHAFAHITQVGLFGTSGAMADDMVARSHKPDHS